MSLVLTSSLVNQRFWAITVIGQQLPFPGSSPQQPPTGFSGAAHTLEALVASQSPSLAELMGVQGLGEAISALAQRGCTWSSPSSTPPQGVVSFGTKVALPSVRRGRFLTPWQELHTLCKGLLASSVARHLLHSGRQRCLLDHALLLLATCGRQELLQVRCTDFPRLPLITWLAGHCFPPQLRLTMLCFIPTAQGWCTMQKVSSHQPLRGCRAAWRFSRMVCDGSTRQLRLL